MLAGNVISGGRVQVNKDGFVGLTAQVLSVSLMSAVIVFPVKSGAGSTILKLIKFEPVSHINTLPVNTGGREVGELSKVGEAVIVAVAAKVGDAATVGEAVAGAGVGVAGGATPQNCASRSAFEADAMDEEVENSPGISASMTIPSGHV
jgi:hypothetical protein